MRVSEPPGAEETGHTSVTGVFELLISQQEEGLLMGRRAAWAKADNKLLVECYVKSEPESRGYRIRLVALWRGCGPREDLKNVIEQRLADQVRQIKEKKYKNICGT